VIVGSGAAGGTLAAHLARSGARVAIVEGGPRVNTRTDFNTHAMPFDYPNRHSRCVFVAGGCVQSVALLLISKSSLYPTGLANSSGALGRHFIPHFTGGIECLLQDLSGTRVTNDEGFLDHAYLPSFMHTRKRDYARSFGAQLNYQNRRLVRAATACSCPATSTRRCRPSTRGGPIRRTASSGRSNPPGGW
jgi:choline dehydrogenase-like flavoprotein